MKIDLGSGDWNVIDAAKAINARLVIGDEIKFNGICTDSREAGPGVLFVAFRGERVDGHSYISKAVELGSKCILAERQIDGIDSSVSFIIVDNSEKALMKMAKIYSERTKARKTIGITGSVGKTTTKEFIGAVLAQKYKTFKTVGNFNSVIGMPLSLMQIPTDTQTAVLEMAMSGFKEISPMSCAATPDIAVITNIGSSHMEMLGSRENICRAKLEILDGLKNDGVAIFNGDEPLLREKKYSLKNIFWVSTKDPNADYYAYNIKYIDKSTVFDVSLRGKIYTDVKIFTLGEHNVYAALFACAVGDILGLLENEIKLGLENYKSASMRQQIYYIKNITVIEDCYNASPESMLAALNVLKNIDIKSGSKRIALLGDMRELGVNSCEYHITVGNQAAHCCDMLFTLGNEAKNIAVGARAIGMDEKNIMVNLDCDAYSATVSELAEVLNDGDVLLVKASRAVRAERVIESLKDIINNRR